MSSTPSDLLPAELAMLERPEVRALPAQQQLEYLRTNRRVGAFVTAFSGGLRLLVLGGAGLTMIAHACGLLGPAPALAGAITLGLVGAGLFAWTLIMTARLRRRVAELRRPIHALPAV